MDRKTRKRMAKGAINHAVQQVVPGKSYRWIYRVGYPDGVPPGNEWPEDPLGFGHPELETGDLGIYVYAAPHGDEDDTHCFLYGRGSGSEVNLDPDPLYYDAELQAYLGQCVRQVYNQDR